ncbi:hypothetical protein I6A60_21995 [Frankia sp. AgB1.9]|uniref:hypothetical protein n=1 Tax=unclassified Frankia TaxID=2632575 RepID=UPI0019337783|nr:MULTISPECIES: hypothetical protein [unclassified Frankia]MBL7493634.1 hypothetical protein [Frankia sp. AgW1.1]MBL7550522.1 hypothetical protein [Frankia sp. AgB1.9]MBL7624962.1 hypothetical protein [Frankia sp. AgB1.8]
MNKILLSLHVLAAILTVGPVAVAASMFPRYLRLAADPADSPGESTPLTVARTLHRICRVYALVGLAVPFFGLALAGPLHVFGQAWVIVSIVLTAAAAALLAAVVLPGQSQALATLTGQPVAARAESVPAVPDPATTADPGVGARLAGRLAMTTGMFNLLWAAVVVIMIVRPGSTTGV